MNSIRISDKLREKAMERLDEIFTSLENGSLTDGLKLLQNILELEQIVSDEIPVEKTETPETLEEPEEVLFRFLPTGKVKVEVPNSQINGMNILNEMVKSWSAKNSEEELEDFLKKWKF